MPSHIHYNHPAGCSILHHTVCGNIVPRLSRGRMSAQNFLYFNVC